MKKAARRSVPLESLKAVSPRRDQLLPLFCVPIGVDRGEAIPLFREIFERENSGYRANGYAGATINAFGRVDVELRFRLESRFVLAGMDAVHRAHIHASSVFCADAGLGNHVGHQRSPLFGPPSGGAWDMAARPTKNP